eukprot:1037087-Heterocapsa_arctica.AAC.1
MFAVILGGFHVLVRARRKRMDMDYTAECAALEDLRHDLEVAQSEREEARAQRNHLAYDLE